MYRLFLAARYVAARPVSYLAMMAIGVAIMALIVVVSVMNGFLEETRALVRGTTADLIVVPRRHKDGTEAVSREEVTRLVSGEAEVRGSCARLVRPAVFKVHGATNFSLANTGFASLNQVLVLGVDAAREAEVTDFLAYLRDVKSADLKVEDPHQPFRIHRGLIVDRRLRNADLSRVLVGELLMNQLGLGKGDAIDVVTVPDSVDLSGGRIRPTTETLVISGAFSTGHQDFDRGHMFVSHRAFKRWTNTAQQFSELYVSAQEGADLPRIRDRLQARLTRDERLADVDTWMDRHRTWLLAVENERNILGFVVGLFVLLTCTITYSMLTMMVQEKTRDIGILSAMGASSRGVGTVFVLSGTAVAALGAAAGMVAGTLVSRHVNGVKDWIESTFDIYIFNPEVYAFTEVPTVVDHGLNGLIAGATLVFAMLICRIPAWRAARMDPVQALRHE